MSKRERLAYLAGLFDGEGCITFILNTGTLGGGLQIRVVNTDLDLLERFSRQFGGKVRPNRARPPAPGYRTTFAWERTGANAAETLRALLPFLVGKRAQARLAIKIRDTRPTAREELLVQLKALKRVDHGGRFDATYAAGILQ